MRIRSLFLAVAAGAAATGTVAAPTQSSRPLGVETKIVDAANGGIRNWQAGPPKSGILYMQDRRLKWYKVTMSGPCIQTHAGPIAVVYTTDNIGVFDRFSRLTFPEQGGQTCGVKSITTSAPPPGQPGAAKAEDGEHD